LVPVGDNGGTYSDPCGPFQLAASDPDSDRLTFSSIGLPAGCTLTDNGDGTATIAGTITAAAGEYPVHIEVQDGFGGVDSDDIRITLNREDTVVRLAQNNPHAAQVTKPNGYAPMMSFTARVTEVTDGSYGEISLAQPVTFGLNPIGGGNPFTCAVPSANGSVTRIVAATATSPGFIDVSCTFPSTLKVPVNVYHVNVSVGGSYYQGSGDAALTVFDPTLGGSNGAGMIVNPSTGNLASFGYTARYNKSSGVVGKMLYIEYTAAGQTILKGNVMATMAIITSNGIYPKTAKITGKSTLDGVGNYSYVLTGVDAAGASTDTDQFGLQVKGPSGNPLLSLSFDPALVDSGNVFVGK